MLLLYQFIIKLRMLLYIKILLYYSSYIKTWFPFPRFALYIAISASSIISSAFFPFLNPDIPIDNPIFFDFPSLYKVKYILFKIFVLKFCPDHKISPIYIKLRLIKKIIYYNNNLFI